MKKIYFDKKYFKISTWYYQLLKKGQKSFRLYVKTDFNSGYTIHNIHICILLISSILIHIFGFSSICIEFKFHKFVYASHVILNFLSSIHLRNSYTVILRRKKLIILDGYSEHVAHDFRLFSI